MRTTCSMISSFEGTVCRSNGGENGTGVSSEPRTIGCVSRFQNVDSSTLLAMVCANPPVHCASCSTMRRPVRLTESMHISSSQGMSVRRSMTSTPMPCSAANCSAALSATCTIADHVMIVRSPPVLTVRAVPMRCGPRPLSRSLWIPFVSTFCEMQSPHPVRPPLSPYRPICSRNTHGSGSATASSIDEQS